MAFEYILFFQFDKLLESCVTQREEKLSLIKVRKIASLNTK